MMYRPDRRPARRPGRSPVPIAAGVLLLGLALSLPSPSLPAPAAVPAGPAPVWSLAFSPDSRLLAAGSYQRIQLWDAAAKAPLRSLTGHAGPVRCLAWSADGKQLAGGGGKPGELGEVKVWALPGDPAAASASATMQEHRDVVEGLAFSATGEAVLSAGIDEKALAVQVNPKKVLATMLDHTNRVLAVAVSPSGKYVATGSLDRTVKIWNAADYKPVANIDAGVGPVTALAFLPAGEQFAVAGEEGNIRVFRLAESRSGQFVGVNGQLIRTIGGNRTPLFTLSAGVRGGLLAAGGQDRTVRVYDANSGGQKYLLKECGDAVYAVAVSPDGTLIAAGSRDGKVRVWTAADGKLAAEF